MRNNQSDTESKEPDFNSQSELEDILESLTRRMIKCEMEDFELDKSAEYSVTSGVGIRNNIFAILVMGIYEVLVEYNFAMSDFNSNSFEQVLQLFKNHQTLSATMKEKVSAGKKTKLQSGKPARSLLSFKFVSAGLHAIFSDAIPSHQHSLTIIRDDIEFVQFITNVAVQKLQQIFEKGYCDGIEGHDNGKLFKYTSLVSKIFLKQYTEGILITGDIKKARQLSASCLEGLTLSIEIVFSRYKDKIGEFLASLETQKSSESEDRDLQEIVHLNVKQFQRHAVSAITSSGNEDHKIRDSTSLLTIISLLGRLLKTSGQEYAQLQGWVYRLATERTTDDIVVARSLIQLLFKMTSQIQSVVPILRDMSQDIHSQLGDVDQDVEVEDKTNFAMVTARSAAPTITLLVLGQMEQELEHCDWILNRIKAEQTIVTGDTSTQELSQRENVEKTICNRLGVMINAFHELVQTAIPMGPCIEALLKGTIKLYGTLASMAKFYLSLYSQGRGHISGRFEKLVKLCGTHLTPNVYSMITWIQATQNINFVNAMEKKKDPKKKQGVVGEQGKARILRETKSIPNLVFSVEQFERYLIQLSKKSKLNLMEHIKLSTSRDFRINASNLQTALEQQSGSEEEELSDSDSDDQDNQTPTTSRSPTIQSPASKKGKLGIQLADPNDQENQTPNTSKSPTIQPPVSKKGNLEIRLADPNDQENQTPNTSKSPTIQPPASKKGKLGIRLGTIGKAKTTKKNT